MKLSLSCLIVLFFLLACKETNNEENIKSDIFLETLINESKIEEQIFTDLELKDLVAKEYLSMNQDIGGFTRPPNFTKNFFETLLVKVTGSKYESRVKFTVDSLDKIVNRKNEMTIQDVTYQSSDNVCLNSEDFIKEDLNYPRTADFSIFDCSVENNNDGSYTVLRKVRAKNAFGVESEFIYKVSLGFIGGNDIDIKNWKLINMRSQELK